MSQHRSRLLNASSRVTSVNSNLTDDDEIFYGGAGDYDAR